MTSLKKRLPSVAVVTKTQAAKSMDQPLQIASFTSFELTCFLFKVHQLFQKPTKNTCNSARRKAIVNGVGQGGFAHTGLSKANSS
jgi:hypothetical protein